MELTNELVQSLVPGATLGRGLVRRTMDLDREYLESKLQDVRLQKENARSVYHQALGAEQALSVLLERLDETDEDSDAE